MIWTPPKTWVKTDNINVPDWQRIDDNTRWIAEFYGVTLPYKTWAHTDFPTPSQLSRIESNINALLNQLWNLNLSGRENLLPNSATIPGLHGWAPSGNTPAVDQGNGFYRVPLNSNVAEILQDQNISVVQGSAYTESFYFKTDSTDLKFNFTFFTENGHDSVSAQMQEIGSGLYRAFASRAVKGSSLRAIDFYNLSYSNGTYIDIAKPQLQANAEATPWSPATGESYEFQTKFDWNLLNDIEFLLLTMHAKVVELQLSVRRSGTFVSGQETYIPLGGT